MICLRDNIFTINLKKNSTISALVASYLFRYDRLIFTKKITTMKNLIPLLIAISTLFLAASCKKSDPAVPEYKLEGKWTGTYTPNLGGGAGGYFALTFKSGGMLLVEANNAATPDIANGTYQLDPDSLRGSFVYAIGIGVNYLISGKYAANSNIIRGTMGIRPSSTDFGTFTVTRQQ